MQQTKKYIAFDVGSKRVGVAVSDDLGMMAFPKAILEANSELFSKIFDLCSTEQPTGFVVGIPDSGSEKANTHTKSVEKFIRELETNFGIPVHRINEYGTSHHAKLERNNAIGDRYSTSSHRSVQGKHMDDKAAMLILERFLSTLR
jgi:putative Holliday junction resolvase